jgi:hypothetical protein
VTAKTHRLLLICPPFFGYDKAIANAAAAQGYAVTLMDARAGVGAVYKSLLKFLPNLTRKATQGRVQRHLAGIEDLAGIDHILVVKGDGLTAETTALLKRLAPNAKLTVYLWDALRNMPGMAPVFKSADQVFTFDKLDSAAFGWSYLPLFARAATPQPATGLHDSALWDWSFIGSLHSDRHRVLRALVAGHPGLRSFVHCYVQNTMVKLVRSLVDPGILSGHPPPLSTSIMGYERYQEVVRQSRAVVDIEHPSQTGMTMRTIETLLDGKKLITTNAAVRDCDLYHPSRVAIIDRKQPLIDPAFLDTPFLPIPDGVRESYHIDAWLKTLLA